MSKNPVRLRIVAILSSVAILTTVAVAVPLDAATARDTNLIVP